MRSRDITFNRGKQNPNQTSTSLQDDDRNKEKSKEHIPCKEPMDKGRKVREFRPPAPVEVENIMLAFSLQTELSKVKISIYFNEFLRNKE